MSDLISTLTSDLQNVFPDATTARCERALNLAHADLVSRLPECARVAASINLVANTPTYDLAAGTTEVRVVYYQTATNVAVRLTLVHVQQLDHEFEVGGVPWQFQVSGTPTKYYIASGITSGQQSDIIIGLYPTPDTTTALGFPILKLGTTEIRTLASTDTIPEGLADGSNFYINRACYHLARELRTLEEAGGYMTLSQESLERCVTMFMLVPREADPRETLPTKRPRG